MWTKIKTTLVWLKNEIIRYPVWATTVIACVIAQGSTLGWWTLDGTQIGEVTAVALAVLGVAQAILTDRFGMTVLVTLGQAVAALSVGFTYRGSDKVSLYIGVALALLGVFGHNNNAPRFGPTGTRTRKKVAAAIRARTDAAMAKLNQPRGITGPLFADGAPVGNTGIPAGYSHVVLDPDIPGRGELHDNCDDTVPSTLSVRDTNAFPVSTDDQDAAKTAAREKRSAAARKGAQTKAAKKAAA